MVGRISDINSGKELSDAVKTLRYAAIYDLFGQVLLHEFLKKIAKGEANAKSLVATLPEGQRTLQDFIDELNAINTAPETLRTIKRSANIALTRNLFKECFRITKEYCDRSGQLPILERMPWFHFARMIANCVSHDFNFRFGRFDLKCLPVTYGGVTIDKSADNQPVSIKLEQLIGLVDEIICFATTLK